MTLRPIPGAPRAAPAPDFPAGKPTPPGAPASTVARPPVEPAPSSLPQPARRSGPIEIRGGDDGSLIFRIIPEVPAINRASMTLSITGEPAGPPMTPCLELATDEAKAFLVALRDGHAPIAAADSRTGFRVEFAIAEAGPAFIVSQPGREQTVRRFDVGRSDDVKAMAEHLLADLGP